MFYFMFGFKQTIGRRHLNSVTSQDSGFTSQDTLYNNVISPGEYSSQVSNITICSVYCLHISENVCPSKNLLFAFA